MKEIIFSEELLQLAKQFIPEAKDDLTGFRRLVGPGTRRYRIDCRRYNLTEDPEQVRLCEKAYSLFFGNKDPETQLEVSICPTVSAEDKKKAKALDDLPLILREVKSGEKMRLVLIDYCPATREINFQYSEIPSA